MAEPVGEGRENMAEPVGEGRENMAEPVGEGRNNMAEPVGEGRNNMAEPVGEGRNNTAEPVGEAGLTERLRCERPGPERKLGVSRVRAPGPRCPPARAFRAAYLSLSC
jgi:hypothetical protein